MKRIVICADGTWNQRDQAGAKLKAEPGRAKPTNRRPTNVTKLARAVLPRASDGVDQVVCYHSGVGTGGLWDRLTGGAFGSGMEANIRELYRFIVYNHVPGDELYLIGFSRGAFTVRSLAGFMNQLGLVSKDDDYYVPELYACYEKKGAGPGSEAWDYAFRKVNKAKWRPCPPIKFVGVLDTVGALGAPGLLGQLFGRHRYKYHDVGLNGTIENAVHALAIDEHRRPFKPTLWARPDGWNGVLLQAWFAGAHSDIGGGERPDGLANEALHWLAERAERLGLQLNGDYLQKYTPCFNATMHPSMTLMYWLMRPLLRRVGGQRLDGELLHQSALDRMALPECRYAPRNLARGGSNDAQPPAALASVNTHRIARGTPCPPM